VKSIDASLGEDRLETSVLVLVDDERANPRILLCLEGVEEPLELVDAAYRRDDEVERRKLVPHGP